ncbi:helix-turn-helix domain-containing protein [Pseudactinotalea sp. HY158]|uniref:helix-turn-helix domain-containing protein n=1 Tax=Pseudactinotalea sp. HY158 TaxID=2654547 RepID=UPI00129C383C|nr:helix-turn-helix transcriptional regulator [Pseudactinotalea sp. HY158]QGH70784.1 helix-turn-helix domain-containing protein [Pseudactinotalea sp. HY158]
MDLTDLLGIESSPGIEHARAIVQADRELLQDLVRARDEAGLTQTQVGERMGISQSAVARIESGQRDLRMSTLRRYVHAVDASVKHIVSPRALTDAIAVTERGLRLVGAAGADDPWPRYRDSTGFIPAAG